MQTTSGEVDYAVGAPNPDAYHGRVYICPNCFEEEDVKRYQKTYDINLNALELKGHQFGERFGQTICAVDLNGDGYHDLVVGAPLHASTTNGVLIPFSFKYLMNAFMLL